MITAVEGSDDYSDYDVKINLYDINRNETVCDLEIKSSFPLSCKISSSGFFIVCKDELINYETDGKEINTFSFNGRTVTDFELTYDKAVLLFDNSGYDISYTLVALNESSTVLYENEITSTVYDIEICGNSTCLLVDNRVLVLNPQGERMIHIDISATGSRLLAYNDHVLYLCTDSAAPLFDIQE